MKFSAIKCLLLCCLLTTAQAVFAQELFKVLLSNKVLYQDSTMVKRPLLNGSKIYKGRIIVPVGGYLAMTHKSGKTVELNSPGVYRTDSIAKLLEKKSCPTSLRLSDFLRTQIPDTTLEYYFTGHYHSSDELRVYAGYKTSVIHDTILICWKATDVKKYEVVIYNYFDEEVWALSTTDTFIRIDMNSRYIKDSREKNLLIRMKNEKGEIITEDAIAITFLLPEKEVEISKQFQQLKIENPEYNVPGLLLQATFYEDNKLLFAAANKYHQAIVLHPELRELKDMYIAFMIRNEMIIGYGDR